MNRADAKEKVLKAMTKYFEYIPVTKHGQRARAKRVYHDFFTIEEYDD